jgi:hypothetical protein
LVFKLLIFRYALFDLGKTATCIFQGLVDGIGTSKSFISHRNVQAFYDIKLQVGIASPAFDFAIKSGMNFYIHGLSIAICSQKLPIATACLLGPCMVR